MARVTVADYTSRDKASLSSGRRDRSRQSLKQGWNQRLQIRTSCCPALLEPKAADDIRPPTTRVAGAASATDEHFHAPWIRGSAQWTISSGSVVIGDEGRLASTIAFLNHACKGLDPRTRFWTWDLSQLIAGERTNLPVSKDPGGDKDRGAIEGRARFVVAPETQTCSNLKRCDGIRIGEPAGVPGSPRRLNTCEWLPKGALRGRRGGR
jgi:hypothetical protein